MQPGNPLEQRVRTRLAELDAGGLVRALRRPAGIDLSSNDYLNLSRHPAIAERFIEGIAREGCGSTGSRLLRGERDCLSAIERRFALFKHSERALFFAAGYLANIAVLSTLPERGDIIFSDEHNHASLIDGMRLSKARTVIVPHNDVAALARLLAEDPAPVSSGSPGPPTRHPRGGGSPGSRSVRFVVTESLFSMEGDIAPLADYAALCRRAGALLVVDEAHAVGVYGARGTGLLEAAGVEAGECVSVNTAGKALGVSGAFVAGPAWAIEYLMQRARPFVFSTAPPPALADALDASLTLVAGEPERRYRVRSLSAYLRARLRDAGIAAVEGTSQIVPVVIGDNDRAVAVARALQREGFDVRAIRPPSVPPGTARLRVSVNVGLSEALLDQFVRLLASVLKEVGLCSAASS
jgi:8-amino-7-oxononanoate synthase